LDKGQKYEDWLECRSDESNRSAYDYKYEEDPVNMMVKKYKKLKDMEGTGSLTSANIAIKDPFIYTEEVLFSNMPFKELPKSSYCFRLKSLETIMPFGYPAEQFLAQLKSTTYASLL
jgi:hypothetical protein